MAQRYILMNSSFSRLSINRSRNTADKTFTSAKIGRSRTRPSTSTTDGPILPMLGMARRSIDRAAPYALIASSFSQLYSHRARPEPDRFNLQNSVYSGILRRKRAADRSIVELNQASVGDRLMDSCAKQRIHRWHCAIDRSSSQFRYSSAIDGCTINRLFREQQSAVLSIDRTDPSHVAPSRLSSYENGLETEASNMAAGVQATNDDATSCKRYAVDKGYWNDPFVKFFCRSSDRKSPEINRGYYARIKAVESCCHQFLDLCNEQGQESQIISLGAGFDTLYWRLHAAGRRPGSFVEMDYPAVVSRKVVTCQSKKILSDIIKEGGCVTSDSLGVYGKHYSIVSVDLRDIDDVGKKLEDVGVHRDKPTLILAECVLVYLETSQTRNILSWASGMFSTALFVNYEPVNVSDQFGQVMLENLRLRSCALLGASDCVSLDRQKSRFLDCGWDRAYALDMWSVYNRLPKDDVQRIERLEFLDEVELLQQLLQHYSISWAVNDHMGIGLDDLEL